MNNQGHAKDSIITYLFAQNVCWQTASTGNYWSISVGVIVCVEAYFVQTIHPCAVDMQKLMSRIGWIGPNQDESVALTTLSCLSWIITEAAGCDQNIPLMSYLVSKNVCSSSRRLKQHFSNNQSSFVTSIHALLSYFEEIAASIL
jgi:hypothetical protein